MTVEAFLHLCVTLRLRNKRPVRTLAILSARRGEGKSTVAYHLAKSSLGAAAGRAADRRGSAPADDAREHALRAIRSASATCWTAPSHWIGRRSTSQPGFDVLTSGADATNPVPLLQSRFQSVLDEARTTYGTVIVDTPALGAVSDGLMIAAQVDGSLFVVAADDPDENDARRAVEQLSLIGVENLLGIVVNKDAVVISDYDDYFARIHRALTAGPA